MDSSYTRERAYKSEGESQGTNRHLHFKMDGKLVEK